MKILTIKGISIEFNWSLLILLLVLMSEGILSGLRLFTIIVISILLHEGAHVYVAQRNGLECDSIILGFFGGMARILTQKMSGWIEVKMAIAGPIMSFILAGIGMALFRQTNGDLFGNIFVINMAMGIFNLIPVYPMDGGRVLRGILGMCGIKFKRATSIAVWVGTIVGILLMPLAIIYRLWAAAVVILFVVIIFAWAEKRVINETL